MMKERLTEAELNVLNILWDCEGYRLPAARIADILKDRIGWSVNTSYTIIGRCIEKGFVNREQPKFCCVAAVGKEDVQNRELRLLIKRLFNDSQELFLRYYVEHMEISSEEQVHLQDFFKRYRL